MIALVALAPLLMHGEISRADLLPHRSDVPTLAAASAGGAAELPRLLLQPAATGATPPPAEPPDYGAHWIYGGIVAGLSMVAIGTGFLIASGGDSGSSCASSLQEAACQAQHDRQSSQQTVTGAVLTAVGPWLLAGMVTYGAISSAGNFGASTDVSLGPAIFLGGGGLAVQTRF